MTANGGAKYSAASQEESRVDVHFSSDDDRPQKGKETCCQKCALYTCFVGFFFILLGLICAFIMKPIVEKKILQQLPFAEGSRAFLGWKNPPVTPVLYLRIFNLTNEREFLAGRQKPILQELGPFAYQQKLQKTDIDFSDDQSTVRYMDRRLFHFAPELSNGSESDLVVVPNLPLFGAMKKMEFEVSYAKTIFKQLLNSYDFATDKTPFLTMTVKEFLWGYPSILMSMARNDEQGCVKEAFQMEDNADWDDFNESWGFDYEENRPLSQNELESSKEKKKKEKQSCDISPGNLAPFGLLRHRNDTSLDPREIRSGVGNLTDKGMMVSWHDMRRVNFWRETPENCNVISNSRDPGAMPVALKKSQELNLFMGNMGRTLPFKYSHQVRVQEFMTYRFIPKETAFDSIKDSPENACFCLKRRFETDTCLPSGLHDTSTANPGSPVLLSWPHFMFGDPELKAKVGGLHPDPAKHIWFFDIEPTYGVTLAALARIQMNVEIVKRSGFGYFDNIREERVVLPFAWVEEGIEGPSQIMTENVGKMMKMPTGLRNLSAIAGIGLGLLLLVPETYFWIRSCFRKGPTDNDVLQT